MDSKSILDSIAVRCDLAFQYEQEKFSSQRILDRRKSEFERPDNRLPFPLPLGLPVDPTFPIPQIPGLPKLPTPSIPGGDSEKETCLGEYCVKGFKLW